MAKSISHKRLSALAKLLKGSGRIIEHETGRITVRKPGSSEGGRKKDSILPNETKTMIRKQRELIQAGHRRLARVQARNHSLLNSSLTEGEQLNTIPPHPWLDSPQYSGDDNRYNPEPPLNSAARREYDNAQREQEMEKQLRLGNMPGSKIKPSPMG